MSNKKTNKSKSVNEPSMTYGEKRIVFFNSFEEAKEQSRIEMAAASYEQRLINLKILRQRSKQFSPASGSKKTNDFKTITIVNANYL